MVSKALVYMVAGMSSRFGGNPKQLARVGPNEETVIEMSLKQALPAGFDEIIFIVGKKTEMPFKSLLGTEYEGIPIRYAKQEFDEGERDKPWGTVDAVLAAKHLITSPFVIANGDDLYGEDAFKQVAKYIESGENVAIGYVLDKSLPENGSVNRGIFSENNGFISTIIEELDISRDNLVLRGLSLNRLCNMNLFGLQPAVLDMLEEALNEFKEVHEGDRTAECLIPVELSALITSNKLSIRLIPTESACLGITNPEDTEILKQQLVKMYM